MLNTETVSLEMKNISIQFPGVKALSNVDFAMQSGEIRALIGANGAGKSTLMKVLAGANETYTGDIYLNGKHFEIRNPRAAKDLGIETVYQEVDTALIPYLSVAENIMFNTLVRGMGNKVIINWTKIRRAAKEVLEKLRMDIDVTEQVGNLPLAKKQMVLIARAVAARCRFLILDEPTAPLSMSETQELFRIVRELAAERNVGVVFISHRIPELFEICQTVTVMRDGKVVANRVIDKDLTPKKIIEIMLGRSFEEYFPKKKVPIGDIVFQVEGLCDTENKVRNVSFNIRSGEIVGISGLVGAGKTELCKVLFGAAPKSAGIIKYQGKVLKVSSPTAAVAQRIALVPEERRKEGVLVSEPVYFNLSAASLGKFVNKFSFVNSKAERESARKYIRDLGIITPSEHQKVQYLSGGNQQKVAVGKWLASDSSVYIMDEPAKGIDVGAKHDIFQLIQALAENGRAILYVSSEISEILAITDRTYVMYNGEFAAEFTTAETNEEQILYYSTGGQ